MSATEARLLLLLTAGEHARQQGEPGKAAAAFHAALDLQPDCPAAHLGLSRLAWPGDDYLAVLARIHRLLRPRRYVEIGVGAGASLALATQCERVVAIDPTPAAAVARPIVREASQTYLARGDLRCDLDGMPPDLCFIDGSHRVEDAAADLLAIERFAGPRTLVALHDCLPLDAATASRERRTGFWTGDVWKLVPWLRAARPELILTTIACPPSGLCLISGFPLQLPSVIPPVEHYVDLRFDEFSGLRPLFALRPADAVERVLRDEHRLP